MDKPFSQACENNKGPIHDVLNRWLGQADQLLEIGSGTGQHAVWFARQFPDLQWHTSDLEIHHAGINAWLDEAMEQGVENLHRPFHMDVDGQWPDLQVPAVFSANTLHIMGWDSVKNFFPGVAKCLQDRGLLFVYGPFNYDGDFTSDSNRRFNDWLGQQNPVSAIRDFEAVNELASANGLTLLEDNAMPANNRLLIWQKTA